MLNNLATILDAGVPISLTSYESIATVSVGSGGQSSIDFTSIPSTYKHLQIRYIARNTRAVNWDSLSIRLNSDTGSNYAYHLLVGEGANPVVAVGQATQTSMATCYQTGSSAGSNIFGAGVIDILDYANTDKFKTARALSGNDLNGSGASLFASGLWRSTSAVTSISLFSASVNFVQYSSFALYGIKG
jgi:hypothetical protein